MNQRSRRRPLVVATGLLSQTAAFAPVHTRNLVTSRSSLVRNLISSCGSGSATRNMVETLSASDAIHRPLHEENVVANARELSSLSGNYGGLYSDMMLDAASKELLNDGVLGFQIEDFDSPLGDMKQIDIEEYDQSTDKVKINVNNIGRRPKSISRSRSGQSETEEEEDEDLPPWLPEIPAKSQILCLNVKQLKNALAQRGLKRTGKKAELQKRLLIWAVKKEGERVQSRLEGLRELLGQGDKNDGKYSDSFVDTLTSRRKAINEQSSRGTLGLVDESYFDEDTDPSEDDNPTDNIEINGESRAQLDRSFNTPTRLNNLDIRELYMQAKFADQNGERSKSKSLLHQLRGASPNDMRVVRRLARMEMEDGNLALCRELLQTGLRKFPNNSHLIHGLGQLERTCGNKSAACEYFQSAIEKNPAFPNPYHALGTLEHSSGNVKKALAVLQKGIEHCPANHRLHHALGDVYADAQMLDMAENAYLAALRHVEREWGKSFVYRSLSYVAYAKHDIEKCRSLLVQSLDVNDMHAQGVIALAQLEESEGNINDARKIYRDSISSYEKKRLGRGTSSLRKPNEVDPFDSSSYLVSGNEYSPSYAGDKWINVFRSWARMEKIHGSYETAHIVYSKAIRMFPNSTVLLTEWAKLQVENNEVQKGKLLFEAACQKSGGRCAEPYRLYAECEMKREKFRDAQSILFRGAQSIAESPDGGADCKKSLAGLFHTWGICEYHLGNLDRSEQLFNDAIRVTGLGESDSNIRSLILYSMSRLEFKRGEYLLAQHCIALSMKEYMLPSGNSRIWLHWADIAREMGNDELKLKCLEQAFLRIEEEKGGTASDITRILEERFITSDASTGRTGSAMKDMFRQTPWYRKVCKAGRIDQEWHDGARLWAL